MVQISDKNENLPFHFEILYAGIEFLKLIEKNRKLSKIEIKPDRKYGADRRIEDLTKFYSNGDVEVVQIKHSIDNTSKIGFGDLWRINPSKNASNDSPAKEGKDIFKFLKSWRLHNQNSKDVRLVLASNKNPIKELGIFLTDIEKLRQSALSWITFKKQYQKQISSIIENCKKRAFVNDNELYSFIKSIYFEKLPDHFKLEERLNEKLKLYGVLYEERVYAYITRIYNVFISQNIDVLPENVLKLVSRLETGLLHEINIPKNYVKRDDLEIKIKKAIESKKHTGGFIAIYAPSGSGKTVLLSRLSEKNADFIPYLCRIRPFESIKGISGINNKERLSSKWFKVDIIQRCYEFGLIAINAGIEDDDNYIDKTFEEALQMLSQSAQNSQSKKIVIIVDALDQVETDKYAGKSVLDAIPIINYPGIVFLLSTWGPNYLPISLKNQPKSVSTVGIELYFTENEIKEYFNESGITLNADQVSIIKKQTNGLAISLYYLAKDLVTKKNKDELIRSLPIYTDVFDWYAPIWNSLSTRKKNCLGYLCFHFAPVKRTDLSEMVYKLDISEFNDLITQISHFLNTKEGYLEPYHDSFRRFITKKFSLYKKDFNKKIAVYYSKKPYLTYTQKYITQHLQNIGFNHSVSKKIFKHLHRNEFFKKLLRSNIEDRRKVEIGRDFVNFFYNTQNISKLVEYAIFTSEIYPTTYDSDVFEKAKIGTEKLIAEIEEELKLPKRTNFREQKEWIFRRLSLGNILIDSDNQFGTSLGHRYIDDGLFRYNLNKEILWTDNDRFDGFWNNLEILIEAMVNAGQYLDALKLVRKVGFKEPTDRLLGYKSTFFVNIHLKNYINNPIKTLEQIKKSSKLERILFYIELGKNNLPIPNLRDYKKLLRDKQVEKYLFNDKDTSQSLDVAEILFLYQIGEHKSQIENLLKSVDIEIPDANHGYIYWGYPGNPRELFLRFIALKSLVTKNFNLEEFYANALENKFSNSTSKKEINKEFLVILSYELTLAQNRLLLRAKKMKWKEYWASLENVLTIYRTKLNNLNHITDFSYPDSRQDLLLYNQNVLSLLIDNLRISNLLFPSKTLETLNKIENIFNGLLLKRADLIEAVIQSCPPKQILIKDKLEFYFSTAILLRQKEKLDSTTKGDNLKSLAVLAANYGFNSLAEEIFENYLKYSRGIWNKGDLRFSNLIDCARTQDKSHFDLILKCLYKITNIVEKTWYWKLDFLESATFADFNMALDYLYFLVSQNEVNMNDGIERIIKSYVNRYPYDTAENIFTLINLMNIKNGSTYNYFENFETSYWILIKWSTANDDTKTAEDFAQEYLILLKTLVSPSERLKHLNKYFYFLADYPGLANIKETVNIHLKELLKQGYKPSGSDDYKAEILHNTQLIKFKKQISTNKTLNLLRKIKDSNKNDHYIISKMITELLPDFEYNELNIVKEWCIKNGIFIEAIDWAAATMKCASKLGNSIILKKARQEILNFMKSQKEYEKYRIIKRLDNFEFPHKKALIRKLMLVCIRDLAGGYSLLQFFSYTSDFIDKYYIDLKALSFNTWKIVFERSMRLSLSK